MSRVQGERVMDVAEYGMLVGAACWAVDQDQIACQIGLKDKKPPEESRISASVTKKICGIEQVVVQMKQASVLIIMTAEAARSRTSASMKMEEA